MIGIILTVKIAIIRRWRRFGHRLPLIGGSLAVVTLASVALAVPPAWQVAQPLVPLSPQLTQGRSIVSRKCVQCHGASLIAGEREDARKWNRITREMQQYSQSIPGKSPILESERVLATAYLSHMLAESEDDKEDDDDKRTGEGRKKRQRGRESQRAED